MRERSLSLLTQEEIDTLVDFLKQQKSSVDAQVLSQDSIDKLISLMEKKELYKIRLDEWETVLKKPFNGVKDWILVYEQNQETNFLELYVVNGTSDERKKLTPTAFEKRSLAENDAEWGYCIPPVIFNEVATAFQLKYTRKTYDDICRIYAEKNYGDSTAKIPEVFLANSSAVLDNILVEE